MLRGLARALARWGERSIFATAVLNRLWYLLHILDFSHTYVDRNARYDTNLVNPINNSPPPLSDEPINFILRCILDRSYERLVEIGAYDLRRAIHYKRLFPNLEVVGLDVISGFEPRAESGVSVDRFDVEWFDKNVGPKTVIVCFGTLAYFAPQELRGFLERVFDLGYDLAIVEYGSHFAKTASLRRSVISYHHPYGSLLKDIGFKIDVRHPNYAYSLNSIERLEYHFATAS